VEHLVAPVVRGVHSISPYELAVDRANPGLRAALLREGSLSHAVASLRERATAGSQVAGFRGGMFRLVDVLLSDLERFGVPIRFGVDVGDVTPEGLRANGEPLIGDVLIAAPGVAAASAPGRIVTVVTLIVDQPELDAAPRGTGVLVSAGAPGVDTRAMTHLTVKWPWLAERTGGLHALRLSYDGAPGSDGDADLVSRAAVDAGTLLGMPLAPVVDAASITWERAVPRTHAVDGMHYIGESGAGTGLVSVIAQAESEADSLLNGSLEDDG
jgi:oxygen-dependent protoporphyrinogen oxidase